MPRVTVTNSEMRWVPLAARRVCYSCGTFLEKDQDKDNCRLCYDVFCTNCLREKMALPPFYGYNDKQPVCRVCVLLLRTFPTFGSRLHRGQGGMLLPPRVAVVVTSCDLPYLSAEDLGGARAGSMPTPKSDAPKSWFGRLIRRLRSDKPAAPKKGGGSSNSATRSTQSLPDLPSSYTRVPTKELLNPSGQRAVLMSLVGWRPMNPDTILCVGPISICVRDILKIYSGSVVSGTAGNGSTAVGSSSSLTPPPSSNGTSAGRRLSAMFGSKSNGGAAPGVAGGGSGRNVGAVSAPFSDGRITFVLQGGFSISLLVGITTFDRDASPVVVRKKSSSNLDSRPGSPSPRTKDDDEDSEYEADDPYCEMFADKGILIDSGMADSGSGRRGSFGGGRRGSWLPGSSARRLEGVTTVDFMTDPKEASQLAENLVKVVRECRGHFAFGRASMALHKDLVPE